MRHVCNVSNSLEWRSKSCIQQLEKSHNKLVAASDCKHIHYNPSPTAYTVYNSSVSPSMVAPRRYRFDGGRRLVDELLADNTMTRLSCLVRWAMSNSWLGTLVSRQKVG